MKDYTQLFDAFASIKVGVVGDVMLDTYIWGKTERISPEAPVPIVSLHHRDHRVGGAGNVALNCRSLGAQVAVLSVTGDDEEAEKLRSLFREERIDTNYLVKSSSRITTNKTRIISRNQQMMRLDAEITNDLQESDEVLLLDKVKEYITAEHPQIIIFEDYNKGVLTVKVIDQIISYCKQEGILTAVDPKRKNFFNYKGVDIFKPNLKEVKEGLNLLLEVVTEQELMNIHAELHRLVQHRISLITLSEMGVFYQDNGHASIIPSHRRNIADVSGAGDTVIAVASLVYAASRNVHLMAEVANIAGGLVCEEVGTVAIDKQKLQHECELLLS